MSKTKLIRADEIQKGDVITGVALKDSVAQIGRYEVHEVFAGMGNGQPWVFHLLNTKNPRPETILPRDLNPLKLQCWEKAEIEIESND